MFTCTCHVCWLVCTTPLVYCFSHAHTSLCENIALCVLQFVYIVYLLKTEHTCIYIYTYIYLHLLCFGWRKLKECVCIHVCHNNYAIILSCSIVMAIFVWNQLPIWGYFHEKYIICYCACRTSGQDYTCPLCTNIALRMCYLLHESMWSCTSVFHHPYYIVQCYVYMYITCMICIVCTVH